MVCEVYHTLKGILKKKYGLSATGVGDEGGFAPQVQSNEEGLVVLQEAIAKAGFEGRIQLAMDVAASELHTQPGKYDLNFKVTPNDGKQVLTGAQLLELYASFAAKYPIISIEDPFDQDDWASWGAITVRATALPLPLPCTPPLLRVREIRGVYSSRPASLRAQRSSFRLDCALRVPSPPASPSPPPRAGPPRQQRADSR